MDRPRRFLLTIPVVSLVAALLIGGLRFGIRLGEDAVSSAPAASSVSLLSAPDETPPRLLPEGEMIRCTGRLEPFDTAAEEPDDSLRWDDAASLDLPEAPAEPANLPDAAEPLLPGATGVSPVPCELPAEMPAEPRREQPGEADGPAIPSSVTTADTSRPTLSSVVSESVTATPWATPYRPGERSAQLEMTARQADQHTRRGFDLASRKAYHSARAAFVQALRVVAQGLDAEHGSHVHGQALAAGLTALDEADDFVPVGSGLEGELDLGEIIGGHGTPVLKLANPQRLTPLGAVGRYVDYAQEQLAVAASGEVAGSMALHALGKLYWSLADRQHAGRPIDDTKALAFFQAALEVCPENYLALNDLGVLLARGGRYLDAQRVLRQSLAIAPDPTVLGNLAQVYRQLGDAAGAQQAEQQAAALMAARGARGARGQDPARPAPPVAWVSPSQFAGSYAAVAGPWQPAPVVRENSQAGVPTPEPVKEASRAWSWDWLRGTRK